MAFRLEEFRRWLKQQIEVCDLPSGHGTAYDETVKPICKDTYQEVLKKVDQLNGVIFDDLKVGEPFRLHVPNYSKEYADKIWIKHSHAACMSIEKGGNVHLAMKDDTPVTRITVTFMED